MANAVRIIEKHREGLPIREQVEANGLLAAARQGKVEPAHLQRFAKAEYLTQDAEIYKYGSMIVRNRDEVPAALFAHLGVIYTAQRRLLVDATLPDVGVDVAQLRGADLPPGIEEFSMAEAWLAIHAGPGEVALAVHTDFQLYAPVAAELVDALGKLDDVPQSVVRYLENYAQEPAELTDRLAEVVEYGLEHGESEDRVLRSSAEIPDLLTGYWSYVAAG